MYDNFPGKKAETVNKLLDDSSTKPEDIIKILIGPDSKEKGVSIPGMYSCIVNSFLWLINTSLQDKSNHKPGRSRI